MFLLDSNVFIEAKNRYYDFSFCPAFWDWLKTAHENKDVFSIDKVQAELNEGADELTDWANNSAPKSFFLPSSSGLQPSFVEINKWINTQNYEQFAVNDFMQKADYYLVAHALEKNMIVITHEVPSDSKKKIKIPNVCLGLSIKFITSFQLLRMKKPQFILQ